MGWIGASERCFRSQRLVRKRVLLSIITDVSVLHSSVSGASPRRPSLLSADARGRAVRLFKSDPFPWRVLRATVRNWAAVRAWVSIRWRGQGSLTVFSATTVFCVESCVLVVSIIAHPSIRKSRQAFPSRGGMPFRRRQPCWRRESDVSPVALVPDAHRTSATVRTRIPVCE